MDVVTFFVDAPLALKDISMPKTICLSLLLKLDLETTPDDLEPEAVLEPEALLEPKVLLLDEVSRRQTGVEELNGMIANLHMEYKKEMAGMGDRIWAALIKQFSTSEAQDNEEI